MKNMGKLNYCVDVSIDGYIARKDHTYDFLVQNGEHLNEFMNSLSDYEIALMGRRTYEVGLKAGVVNPDLPIRQIVISSTLTSTIDRRIELISGNVVETIRLLKANSRKNILISGGASLASSLLKNQLIDNVNLRIHPVVIGTGIPAFYIENNDIHLKLAASKTYSNGVVSLWYNAKA
jgi:dihydrofolate reductase